MQMGLKFSFIQKKKKFTDFTIVSLPTPLAITIIWSVVIHTSSIILAWKMYITLIYICERINKANIFKNHNRIGKCDTIHELIRRSNFSIFITFYAILILPSICAVTCVWSVVVHTCSIIFTRIKITFINIYRKKN